ncbi:DEAD/DEAH box helicase [Candidatus Poribacteria bacterium]|jgi:superfamily II DNA or RNA helicase|nr:DEAD/DEAH box helicase [Candidatus Poribacteria bacterium]MBT5534910.1 DEAD/DEAH box helicase [Candidatus Poribacteria bacterium]MBT5712512.1 DEAD/DEAH box helicase [Candidatus Poribacteria bacterium]MBT7100245.1 DEAD/DEAH box helicase [Candidatus Poribacteria bacterium]MBT7803921.1 DEAD/DEAH box helicase [Candidatus Poribacteria bacterium]
MPDRPPSVQLRFAAGTLEIRALPEDSRSALPSSCRWDHRTECFRAPAVAYADVVRALVRDGASYEDEARKYGVLPDGLQVRRDPRPFQTEALEAWREANGRGLVVLPTGAGKTYVALLAIDAMLRDTLVVAPTLDLVAQWYDVLKAGFRQDIGVLGGGEHIVRPITVGTYDSAYIHMENLGASFGMVVFDECHHLPGDAFSLAAQSCLAPYRLGLTATPERADGRHDALTQLVGPIAYRRDIDELAGDYLADYHVERILVELTADERDAYAEARGVYRDFVAGQGIRMSSPDGWTQFIIRSSISAEGRRAMAAYQRQRSLAFAAPSKLAYVDHLLHRHRNDRVLLFTERNNAAYEMSRRFLAPVITHQTKVTERSAILEKFGEGVYNVLATSKVLNEGVDMPDANVGIVISGSGSVREHVQRLGRILRRQPGKSAVLYELVAEDTSEMYTSSRRREHVAYN